MDELTISTLYVGSLIQ